MQQSSMHICDTAKMTASCLRRCLHGLLAVGLSCGVLLAGATARAQAVDPRESQSHSECLAGRFQAGVDLLAQLFVETGDVNYIYNQGRCYEQNGKFGEAILRFREFLRESKGLSAEEKAEVNGHIAECQAMKAEQGTLPGAAVPVAPSAEVPPATRTTITPALPAPTAAPTPAGVVETASIPPFADSRGAGLRTAGIVTGSVGAAFVVAGVIFSIDTHSVSSDVASNAAHRNFSRTTYDRGKLFEELQWVGYGVGAAALAAGGVLYYLGYQAAHSSASDSVSLLLMPFPGGTGAVVQGSF